MITLFKKIISFFKFDLSIKSIIIIILLGLIGIFLFIFIKFSSYQESTVFFRSAKYYLYSPSVLEQLAIPKKCLSSDTKTSIIKQYEDRGNKDFTQIVKLSLIWDSYYYKNSPFNSIIECIVGEHKNFISEASWNMNNHIGELNYKDIRIPLIKKDKYDFVSNFLRSYDDQVVEKYHVLNTLDINSHPETSLHKVVSLPFYPDFRKFRTLNNLASSQIGLIQHNLVFSKFELFKISILAFFNFLIVLVTLSFILKHKKLKE